MSSDLHKQPPTLSMERSGEAPCRSCTTQMCPHCGCLVPEGGLTPVHDYKGERCEGSEQNPRCWMSDRRTLWNGKPNPHLNADGSRALAASGEDER